jgi:hypothetical protein
MMAVQSYEGEDIVEIPMIFYDGQDPALAASDGRNLEIDALNRSIRMGVQQVYEEFTKTRGENEWIEIRAYPFMEDPFLQFVVTYNTYPSYGTDGTMFSCNFNLAKNHWMTLAEQLEANGLTPEALAERVRALYQPEASAMDVGEVTAVGFLMRENHIDFLLEVLVENSAAEPWLRFFSYTPLTDTLTPLNPAQLFDPQTLLPLDPPLFVGK